MSLTAQDLAERFRHAISDSGLTQGAVAKAADMDPTALSKALTGKRNFSSLEVAQLCDALRLSPRTVLSDGEPAPPPSARDVARVRWMAELDILLTEIGYPSNRERRYPATLLDRAVEAWLAGSISIRPIAGLIGVDADDLLAELPSSNTATCEKRQ